MATRGDDGDVRCGGTNGVEMPMGGFPEPRSRCREIASA